MFLSLNRPCQEYPIRCAERIELIESLPSWSRIPELREVHSRHWNLASIYFFLRGEVWKVKPQGYVLAFRNHKRFSFSVFVYWQFGSSIVVPEGNTLSFPPALSPQHSKGQHRIRINRSILCGRCGTVNRCQSSHPFKFNENGSPTHLRRSHHVGQILFG